MEPATAYTPQALDDGARHAALRAVLKLLEHWQCSDCLLYTSPSPRDRQKPRMPSSA